MRPNNLFKPSPPSTLLFLFMLVSALGSCSLSNKAPPNCSKHPELSKLDTAERAALADAMVRYGDRCQRQRTTCDVSLTRNNRGEILVTVASVYPDQDSGHCLQAPGDQDVVVYTTAGAFMRQIMSL